MIFTTLQLGLTELYYSIRAFILDVVDEMALGNRSIKCVRNANYYVQMTTLLRLSID